MANAITRELLRLWLCSLTRVSEQACFGAAMGIYYAEPAPAPAPGKREHDFGIFENRLQIV